MRVIQVVLVLSAIGVCGVYFTRFRSVLRDRVIALLLLATAIVAILFPDLTTAVARLVGVGRGTDLLLYLLAAATAFGFILLYSRHAALDRRQAELIRHLALVEARRPAGEPEATHATDSRSWE